MQLRFPVEIKAIVRELHETHLFDEEGERIVGSVGDGPRLKECRLRVAFEMTRLDNVGHDFIRQAPSGVSCEATIIGRSTPN